MPANIPLFPLGTVLFPGVVLPLHVFEPRYRALVRDLMDVPDSERREFGVVAIRQGWEVGTDGVTALYRVGCTAELRQVAGYDDGRFDVVTVGRRRFALRELVPGHHPYLRGTVEWLAETTGSEDEATVLSRSVAEVFGRFQSMLLAFQPAGDPTLGDRRAASAELALPDEPDLLSYLVGASAPLTLDDRQGLLAIDDTVLRLRHELRLLKREATMLSRLRAVPVPLAELRVPMSLN
ncbi:MAG TPA: LON peptidase substrate-binding domain-containing protein [Cryptosporangiaceae bacterium]|nr:LON peptidase substrate-binding domain-containing protein [Cryptosporangiaceae bacterium]